jgi:hypothetical protein
MEIAAMLSWLVLMLGLFAQQTPAQTPTPPAAKAEAAQEDPAVTALALKIYAQIRAGKVDESLMTDAMNKELGPSVLAQYKPIFDQLGDPQKLTLESSEKTAQGTSWVYLAAFAVAQLHVHILVTTDGKVGGYRLAP